jgi:glycosyltransferase involved in cell wall biosynthesis
MSLSLCIIVRNELAHLESFLKHHKDLYDELIIVDTGSKDKTIEIAKGFTTTIFKFKWKNDFSKARNFAISKATKDYIIWLDPDEFLGKEDFNKLKKLNPEYLGFSLIQRTWTNAEHHPRFRKDSSQGYKGYFIRRICKVFKNNQGIKFEYPIHETVINGIKDKIKHTDIIVEHYPETKGKKQLIKKEKNYIKLIRKKSKLFKESNAKKELVTEKIILEDYNNF